MSDHPSFKCPECDRFIGYINLTGGWVKIKCPKCKNWVVIMAPGEVVPPTFKEQPGNMIL